MATEGIQDTGGSNGYYDGYVVDNDSDIIVDEPSPGASGVKSDVPDDTPVTIVPSESPALPLPNHEGEVNVSDLYLMLTKLQSDGEKVGLKDIVETIRHHVQSQQKANNDRFQAMKDNWDALEKKDKLGIWGKILDVVQKYIVPVATMILGGVLIGLGAAPLGVFLIACGAINMTMSSDKVQNALAKCMDRDALIGLNIGIAAAELIAAVAIMVATGGAGSVLVAAEAEEVTALSIEAGTEGATAAVEAGTEAAEITAEGVTTAVETGEGVTTAVEASVNIAEEVEMMQEGISTAEGAVEVETAVGEGGEAGAEAIEEAEAAEKAAKARKIARVVQQGTTYTEAAVAVAADGEGIAEADLQNDADKAMDRADRFIAEILRLTRQREMDQKFLREILDAIQQTFSGCNEVLDGQRDQLKDFSQQLSESMAY